MPIRSLHWLLNDVRLFSSELFLFKSISLVRLLTLQANLYCRLKSSWSPNWSRLVRIWSRQLLSKIDLSSTSVFSKNTGRIHWSFILINSELVSWTALSCSQKKATPFKSTGCAPSSVFLPMDFDSLQLHEVFVAEKGGGLHSSNQILLKNW